jgi:hypothetical protein
MYWVTVPPRKFFFSYWIFVLTSFSSQKKDPSDSVVSICLSIKSSLVLICMDGICAVSGPVLKDLPVANLDGFDHHVVYARL